MSFFIHWNTPESKGKLNPAFAIFFGWNTPESRGAEKEPDILTVAYTTHDLSGFTSVDEIGLTYHLTYLNRLLLLAFFGRIGDESFDFSFTFNYNERQFLYKLARIYLFDTPASFPNQAIASLKTVEDYAVQLLRGIKEPIAGVIKGITKAKTGVEVDLSNIDIDKKLQLSHKDNFINIVELLKKVGYNAIFVLVDKVDEQNLTGNNPEASFKLIAELIKDLELLEIPGISFKFFLWDALKTFAAATARPDRVFSYNLKWDSKQMQEMLDRRVKAYSKGKIGGFLHMFEDPKSLGRIILFSELTPRDCVRICNRVLSEQHKKNHTATKFEADVVDRSIKQFCEEKCKELIPNSSNLNHLRKTNQVSFTVEELVSKQVASDTGAIRNIINPWQVAGYLKKIGLVARKNAKSVNEYAYQDIRLAFIACPTLDVDTFISQKVRRCQVQTCKTFFYRDFDRKPYPCPVCNTLTN